MIPTQHLFKEFATASAQGIQALGTALSLYDYGICTF
jgi:hypothetical protein